MKKEQKAAMLLRNMPVSLRRKVKSEAAKQGKTMERLVIEFIKDGLKKG